MLQMYFGEPYVIDLENTVGSITIYSPTIGDVISIGEKKFFDTLNLFITNTTQWRLPLWEMGLDWNKLSDFDLFCVIHGQANKDVTRLIFGDLDFSDFQQYEKVIGQDDDGNDIKELSLLNKEMMIEINKDVYNHISQYLRAVFNIYPEEKITNSEALKMWYINKDKRARRDAEEKAKNGKSPPPPSIQPLISACINHPGFKYKLKELKEVGVMEFYDSVSRLQIYEQCTALMKGMYSGFIDTKHISPDDYNWMREIIRDTNNSVSKKLKDNG